MSAYLHHDGDGACCGCHALPSEAILSKLPSGLVVCERCAGNAFIASQIEAMRRCVAVITGFDPVMRSERT